ncbi:hypothetical protein [Ornithinimicrobium murale]|uniref:hypothetical protein n=1 Tax=Ornithinimicrobium murale TaxID=1050153 RepID=UPI000E0CF0C5|nr:hypothetical protein [Ornithinimicrobium murale]
MTTSAHPTPTRHTARSGFTARWPAGAITVLIGAFVAVVGALWVTDHVLGSEPVDATGWVILAATLLRLATIGVALASIQHWGRQLPAGPLLAALWGCAAAQLIYPVAETMVKALILLGAVELPPVGIGNMTSTGWFNFAAAWLVFGVPGALFVAAARSYQNRTGARWCWAVAGTTGGGLALLTIGLIIG